MNRKEGVGGRQGNKGLKRERQRVNESERNRDSKGENE